MIGKLIMWFKIFLVLPFVLGFATFGSAAEFPEKPIELLMCYGLGSPTASLFRVVAEIMSKYLPKPVIQVSAMGAGGTLCGDKCAHRVKPDGYTLMQVNSGTNGVALFTKKDITYKEDDFQYLAEIDESYIGLMAAPNAPFKTLEEYMAFARKNPNVIKHASTGVGTVGHLVLELMKVRAGGLKIDLVPFRTSPEVTKAVVNGTCQSASQYGGSGGPNDAFQTIVDGGARILAVSTKERLEAWPQIPTFTEKGYDVVYHSWFGIGGPKGMPNNVVLVLKNALYKAIQDPQVVKLCQSLGYKYAFRKQEEFTAMVKEYNKVTAMVVKEAKIPPISE